MTQSNPANRDPLSDAPGAHPVGTGPFRLLSWKRSSRIVLERNPRFREVYYDEQAPADNPEAQLLAARLKGRRLPMVDRVEVAIIEEKQPTWLAFLNNCESGKEAAKVVKLPGVA